jgi:imidazolonepropionase-like amidohydrolase
MSTITLALTAFLSSLAIEHVRLEAGDGTVRDDITVVVEGERISAVGPAAAVPVGATRIDGRGLTLTPGLVDLRSHLGLVEVELEPATVDTALRDTPGHEAALTPAFRVADGFNPLSIWLPISREEGVTSVVLQPEHGVLAGTGTWLPLTGALGEQGKSAALFGTVGRDGADISGGARGGLWLKLREAFADARWYARNKAAYEQNKSRALSLSPFNLEALLPVLERKLPLVLAADRASDILAALRFAQEENLRLVISGGAEAHLVSAQLAKAQVPVVLVPSQQVPGSFEQLRARDDAAALLSAAGVPLVVGCADSSHRRLRQEAGLAVAYGLPRSKALATITSNPARALGLEKEFGTVEPGKRADLVLWAGDPLELSTLAQRIFIGGVEQSLVTRQTKLVERYLKRVAAKTK